MAFWAVQNPEGQLTWLTQYATTLLIYDSQNLGLRNCVSIAK